MNNPQTPPQLSSILRTKYLEGETLDTAIVYLRHVFGGAAAGLEVKAQQTWREFKKDPLLTHERDSLAVS